MNRMTQDLSLRVFLKYVMQNVLGMIGMSAYILADTYFISVANGVAGIATLNLALPVYALFFSMGAMIGVGAATRFTISLSKDPNRKDFYYSNSIIWALILGVFFILAGLFLPGRLLRWMGGDDQIVQLGTPYFRTILLFAPLFMMAHIVNAFTQNDGAPAVAMVGLLASSLFNVLFDYILMFPLRLGMRGAALATAFSPIVNMAICSKHVLSKKSRLRLRWQIPSVRMLYRSCQLGIPAFIGEFSAGITTLVFNTLILAIAGNGGVAAYGVIANISAVIIAVFNGIAQGGQPLISYSYGSGEREKQQLFLRCSLFLSGIVSACVIAAVCLWPEGIVRIFNSENDRTMQDLAVAGIRVYFAGMIFAGANIVGTSYLSAVGVSFWSSLVSVLRGIVAIALFAMLLSHFFGMRGIWISFPVTEAFSLVFTVIALVYTRDARISENRLDCP